MADKVGMSLDQIIKLNRKSRGPARGRGVKGRGGAIRRNDNVGRGAKFRESSKERGRGRGMPAGVGRGRIGRGNAARNVVSARQTFSSNSKRKPMKVTDAREKLKSKVDAREKLKQKVDAREKLKQKVDAREKLKAKVDAREKLRAKVVFSPPNKAQTLTKKIHQDIKKEQRSTAFNERRKFDLTSTGIKITTRQEERETEMSDNSITITARGSIPSLSLSSPNYPTSPRATAPRTLMGDGVVRVMTDNKPRSLPSLPKMQSTERLPNASRTVDLLEERLGAISVPESSRAKKESVTGTRVIITNLHHQVSQADIEELFGVIGNLQNAKILGDGVAEVIYSRREDAIAAFQKYHNRNLDGLPMQCRVKSLPSQPLYSPPTLRSDSMNVNKPVIFKVKI